MDTVWRGDYKNGHEYKGTNVGGYVEGNYDQMDPCDTCGDPDNWRTYMRYANSNKDY